MEPLSTMHNAADNGRGCTGLGRSARRRARAWSHRRAPTRNWCSAKIL